MESNFQMQLLPFRAVHGHGNEHFWERPLEVVEAELLLERLVHLLANPLMAVPLIRSRRVGRQKSAEAALMVAASSSRLASGGRLAR